PHPTASLFTQVEVSPGACRTTAPDTPLGLAQEQTRLLHDVMTAMDRQNELLEELVNVVSSNQRQRNADLAQWKQANPGLAKSCRHAAEMLSRVQAEFLQTLTSE